MDDLEKYTNEKKTGKLESSVRYPNLTFTDHEKNIHTPSLTNAVNNLENSSYEVQKIETGSSVMCLQFMCFMMRKLLQG